MKWVVKSVQFATYFSQLLYLKYCTVINKSGNNIPLWKKSLAGKKLFAEIVPKILHGKIFFLRVVIKSIIKFRCFDLLNFDYFEMNVFASFANLYEPCLYR